MIPNIVPVGGVEDDPISGVHGCCELVCLRAFMILLYAYLWEL